MKTYYPEGWQRLEKSNSNTFSDSGLADACATGTILQSVATMCDNEHNLLVDLGSRRGIIPRTEGALGIAEGTTRDIALISRVGKPVCFTVVSLKCGTDGRPEALLSRRAAQKQCMEQYISSLQPGDIINAKITHLESFGAFCDIGCGIVALLPIDAVSVSRISHPADRLSPGENIRAIIRQITPEGRITLSQKELLGTWEENAALFEQGQTVPGIVRSIEDYGVFIELTPNLAGLAEPKEGIKIGQQASVYIKSIIPEKMKIKLIIIDHFDSDYSPRPEYFIEENHIDRWQYSPDGCIKQIATEF